MTQYELKLREIAEELASVKSKVPDAELKHLLSPQTINNIAALCLEKMADAGSELYKRRTQQGDLNHHLISLGYKKEGT